jgi:hypothetical protein
MSTANNWVQTGALRSADLGVRGMRKPRVFNLITMYEAKVAAEGVKWLDASPLTAAGIARSTTAPGQTWFLSIPGYLAKGTHPPETQAVIFWSDRCRGWDAWIEVPSNGILRVNMKAIAEKRDEPKLAERPFLILPVRKYFVGVYRFCQTLVDSAAKHRDT